MPSGGSRSRPFDDRSIFEGQRVLITIARSAALGDMVDLMRYFLPYEEVALISSILGCMHDAAPYSAAAAKAYAIDSVCGDPVTVANLQASLENLGIFEGSECCIPFVLEHLRNNPAVRHEAMQALRYFFQCGTAPTDVLRYCASAFADFDKATQEDCIDLFESCNNADDVLFECLDAISVHARGYLQERIERVYSAKRRSLKF